jgi:predicted RNA-binding Zn ribbon-like protein
MPATFQLIAAHPVLDFVNTLDNRFIDAGPTELLCRYADLLRFTEQAGLMDAKRAGALAGRKNSAAATRSLAAALELREALAALLYGRWTSARPPSGEIVKTLERKFLEADGRRELVWKSRLSDQGGTSRVDWEWGRFEKNLEFPVWVLAQSAARLLTSTAMNRVHMCHSETCRWLFLDTSKNHTRRWCDMKICGNRMKARSFHARRVG